MNGIVSKNMKLFRDSFGLTQDRVASFLGIDRGAYANYEVGRDMPYDLMKKLCDLYGIALISFYEEDEEKVKDEMACSFRTDSMNEQDLKEISTFKKIVRNYLKIRD
ncbi:helix-turn-helix transcriptional regulator [Dysgonomonas sp. GY617]|uniref:helix-turn-helix transcriptional regulator n=1 Tax=Dysgonomonas sp. GY617 TaxID=2780420 RepID=UPI001883F5D8|nr:helix-turn-helix transcriptional regulator [Dysgonomonas sp. GY617]MBF0578098.1 helix-turn-helix transcriptional regulator [Dysgonomonas sp. GY617]